MAQDRNKSNVRGKGPSATVERVERGDTLLITLAGLIDEHFAGFGKLGTNLKVVVINTSGLTRMTSFGVRQWIEAMDAVPKTIAEVYLLGCPTFFVDQLNMVLNFGRAAKVLTTVAPYLCPGCGRESSEIIDVVAGRSTLVKGVVPERMCRCGEKLEFDETPDSYFAFVAKYAPTSLSPEASQLLAAHGLYTSTTTAPAEKPPKILKLVHGSVTYFRISGTIGTRFRARPLVVGAEGEVVIDLSEVDRFETSGQLEWQKLIKSLGASVPAITLVDVGPPVLVAASERRFTFDKGCAVASVQLPYRCTACGRSSNESAPTPVTATMLGERVCSSCGGSTKTDVTKALLSPLEHANVTVPPDSAKLIARRDEMLSRALVDAKVAEAGEGSAPAIDDDSIFGKYKVVRRLSAGGMAEVFLANQVGIGGFEKPVALKRIQRQLLERRHLAVDMFLNEAKIAARLMHPNIVQVLDVGESAGALYLAMEYVKGRDFQEMLKRLRSSRIRMPFAEACYIIREVALALNYAYWGTDIDGKQMSVVHRDVSPHNIILGFDGAVKLLDFGVAMSAVTEAETMLVGKWMYMSPEHTTNKNVDHRSDLFSLGVILYQCCTGKAPFASANAKDTVRKIREGDFTPVQQRAPEIPDALATLIHRVLSPDPANRPQTGQELAAALDTIARDHKIDITPRHIARLMAEVFPEDAAPVTPSQPGEAEPTKVMDSGLAWLTTGSEPTPEPSSLARKPTTSASLSKIKLDFSVSLVPKQDPGTEVPEPDDDDDGMDSGVAEPVLTPSRASAALIIALQILGILAAVGVLLYLTIWS